MSSAPTEDRLCELLLRWDELRRQGRDVSAGELCADCPELVDELRRRIEVVRDLEPVLDVETSRPVATPGDGSPDGSGSDRRLPDALHAAAVYRPRRHHAQGGLGEVLAAHQEDLDRTVALKRIRPDRLHETARRRFLREAAITARLQHPGIVPIYGLGQDKDGPFYTMPFIEGRTLQETIDAFHGDEASGHDAGRRALKFRGLLQQFIAVCNTMAYAHDQGVIHRDLKPSNIMLGPYGETLVVDWGLAKRLGTDDAGGEAEGDTPSPSPSPDALTAAGAVLGTLYYMSPEQARGEPTSPASDVFSLGLILYAILTGESPYADAALQGGDLQSAVREAAVVPPRRRNPGLPGALEAICLRALAARPEGRYSSARALADDLSNWLADEPVSAYREPWNARLARVVRRHSAVSATAVATVLVVMGALAVAYQREAKFSRELTVAFRQVTEAEAQANHRFDETMKAVEDYYTGVSAEALRGGSLSTELRDRLLERPRKFYSQLTRELASRPSPSERELVILAKGQENLGNILRTLGLHSEARREYEAAISVFSKLLVLKPDNPDYLDGLASHYNRLGIALREPDKRAAAHRAAIAAYTRLIAIAPASRRHQHGLAATYNNLGTALRAMGNTSEAAEAYRASIRLFDGLVAADPGALRYQHGLAWCHTNLANVLLDTGCTAEAIQDYEMAMKIRATLATAEPDNPDNQEGLAGAYLNLSVALGDADRLADAADAARKAIAVYSRLTKSESGVPDVVFGLVTGNVNLCDALRSMGRFDEAAQAARSAIEVCSRLAAGYPENRRFQHGLAASYSNLGEALLGLNRPVEAAEAARSAIEIADRLSAARSDDQEVQSLLGSVWDTLGQTLAAQGWHTEAVDAYRKAIKYQRPVFEQSPQVLEIRRLLSGHYRGLAGSLRALKQVGEAVAATQERARVRPQGPAQHYDCARELALCVPIAHDDQQKHALARAAIDTLRAAITAGWSDASRTSREPDLASLHDREDFRQLLAEMFDRGFPADPFAR